MNTTTDCCHNSAMCGSRVVSITSVGQLRTCLPVEHVVRLPEHIHSSTNTNSSADYRYSSFQPGAYLEPSRIPCCTVQQQTPSQASSSQEPTDNVYDTNEASFSAITTFIVLCSNCGHRNVQSSLCRRETFCLFTDKIILRA